MTITPASKTALTKALTDLSKKYGEGFIADLANEVINTVPTGLPSMNAVIGLPGLPRGKWTELFGRESTGKSLIAAAVAKAVIKAGGTVLYLDYENSVIGSYLETLGLTFGANFLLTRPDTMEAGFEIASTLVATGTIDLVVFDSIAAMLPKTTSERDTGDQKPGEFSKILSICLSQFLPIFRKADTAILGINQLRTKINTGWAPAGAETETTSGGNALKFYTHVRLRLRRKALVKTPQGITGVEIVARAEKNKVGVPFKEGSMTINFGTGFDAVGAILDMLEEIGLLKVGTTGWIECPELLEKPMRGKDNFRDLLRNTPAMLEKAELLLRTHKAVEDSTTMAPEIDQISFDEEIL